MSLTVRKWDAPLRMNNMRSAVEYYTLNSIDDLVEKDKVIV